MTGEFHGDRPIAADNEDRFGIAEIADRLATGVLEQSGSKGLVIGIEGPWGSGKSSMLALTMARIGERGAAAVATVDFRPWLVGDRDQLLAALFDVLVKAVASLEHEAGDATRKTGIAVKSVSEKVRSYAQHLQPAGKLVSLAGVAVPGLGLVGTAMEKMGEAAAAAPDGPTLSAQKDDLAAALQQLGKRIVVAVDDVDRLEPREVGELLRLVRSVADFPNVTYLLCYDGKTLATSIQTATGVTDGRAFLEKIVLTEVSVPRPESFALRRMFTDELAKFASCGDEAGQRLLQIIDVAGGRCFDTPRTVVRVLDSLRLFWPTLRGKVDLPDLVWLRTMAVACPNIYRWAEAYLDILSVMATGRGIISQQERADSVKRLDAALAADGTEWGRVVDEFHMVLPRLGLTMAQPDDDDDRLFADSEGDGADAADRRRLASPDHSRLYFAMTRALSSVDSADIDMLLAAAFASAADATALFEAMALERNVSGATKAERMLDQLPNLPGERFLATDLPNLAFATVAVAEHLSNMFDDEWGQPRAWRMAKKVLRTIRIIVGKPVWSGLFYKLARDAPQLEFLAYLLRGDTSVHGIYGMVRSDGESLTTREEFDGFRDMMFARFRALGIVRILESNRPAVILYGWSQAGGRDEMAAAVAAYVAGDDARLIGFLGALVGRSRDTGGTLSTLSPEGLECFFDDVPDVLDNLIAMARAGAADAKRILDAVSDAFSMHNDSVHDWISRQRLVTELRREKAAGVSDPAEPSGND